jgi:hypothetical protein
MNIVVALHGKTCFVIARPFFLSVLIWLHVTHLVYLVAAALDYEMPADRRKPRHAKPQIALNSAAIVR